MLEVTKFNKSTHLSLMNKWLSERGLPVPVTGDFLAPTGYVISFEFEPVVLGFMVKCDNKTAIYQDFVSDPNVLKWIRNKCAKQLRRLLDAEATRSGLQVVICTTETKAHADNLIEQGYKVLHEGLTELGRILWL